jgi:hypothetical protein
MKKLMCSQLTGKIYYADVEDKGNGLFIVKENGSKKEIEELEFLECMINKLIYENKEIILETDTEKYKMKLEILKK